MRREVLVLKNSFGQVNAILFLPDFAKGKNFLNWLSSHTADVVEVNNDEIDLTDWLLLSEFSPTRGNPDDLLLTEKIETNKKCNHLFEETASENDPQSLKIR